MIYLVNPEYGGVHPALVVHPDLAIPIYSRGWGVSSSIQNWRKAGLHNPSHAILSQPWRKFRRRRHIGALDLDDRVRLVQRAALGRPELLPELRDTL